MQKEQIQQWTYSLDKENQNYILIKLTFSENMNKIIEFVIIYLTMIDNKPNEVVKFDGSEKEPSHKHKNYEKKKEKLFQNKSISYETIEEITNYIENNWRMLKVKYLENK